MTEIPTVGTRLAGRYDLEAEAGEGGFAKAFVARDTLTGETVAVKIPNYEGSSNDPDVIDEYFHKEGETLSRIEAAGGHPNVMTLVDRGTHDGVDFLVVEYIDGYELDEAIEELGPREDTEEVRQVGIDLSDAMGFLHEAEIVYRDLKPDNVMLTERDGRPTPVLIDFNTATGFDADGHAEDSGTTILGPYKPPEVAEAGSSDIRQGPWSDVYSIGKILLFLLRGTVPKKDGINPRDFGIDTEPYLADIVEKATRSNYEERYPNATVMKDVLAARDPSPPPKARLTHLQGNAEYTVYPGDTIGRRYAKGPTPSIAIEDEGEYISTVQVQFDIEGDQWMLRDRSTNGTYVQSGDGWEWVLSADGRERLREQGENPADRHGNVPPETYPLTDGSLVALVHPSYKQTFQFEEE
ncbi:MULTISPECIES: serine/threonine protein kinase [Salinibaculum]|uniref:serine/threonine protein kinase n=1 Tax=Salinibaculum TaxID=2732368 RepID=UPI0030D3F59D